MSNIQFSLAALNDVSGANYGGEATSNVSLRKTHGTTAASYVFTINYSSAQSVDAISIVSCSQKTGLTFDLDINSSAFTQSFSQSSETYDRATHNQLLTFSSIAATEIELTITGITDPLSITRILPFATEFQPSRNYESGAFITPGFAREMTETRNSAFSGPIKEKRSISLDLIHLPDQERDEFYYMLYKAGKNPLLIRTDPALSSAQDWLVALPSATGFTDDFMDINSTKQSFIEADRWR